ncbi:MAG: hypothetical protein ACOY3I_01840 [Verrucomicrobiota bacterium]
MSHAITVVESPAGIKYAVHGVTGSSYVLAQPLDTVASQMQSRPLTGYYGSVAE